MEISDSWLNSFLGSHNCKVIFTIISVTLVGEGGIKQQEERYITGHNKTRSKSAISSDHFLPEKAVFTALRHYVPYKKC